MKCAEAAAREGEWVTQLGESKRAVRGLEMELSAAEAREAAGLASSVAIAAVLDQARQGVSS